MRHHVAGYLNCHDGSLAERLQSASASGTSGYFPPDGRMPAHTEPVTTAGDDPVDRAQRAFDHAVDREKESIAAHEHAATVHDEAAALNEQAALHEADPAHLDDLVARAEAERERGSAARSRADRARQRLRAEGVEVDG